MTLNKPPEPNSPGCPLCEEDPAWQDDELPIWGHSCKRFATPWPIYWTHSELAYLDFDEVREYVVSTV